MYFNRFLWCLHPVCVFPSDRVKGSKVIWDTFLTPTKLEPSEPSRIKLKYSPLKAGYHSFLTGSTTTLSPCSHNRNSVFFTLRPAQVKGGVTNSDRFIQRELVSSCQLQQAEPRSSNRFYKEKDIFSSW